MNADAARRGRLAVADKIRAALAAWETRADLTAMMLLDEARSLAGYLTGDGGDEHGDRTER